MCRAACYTVADPRPNVVLLALVREAFPDDHDSDGSAAAVAEVHSEGQPKDVEGPEVSRVLPLFLSTSVQLPMGKSSMHLFEPRYRLLTQRALDCGGDFAMVWARHGRGFPMHADLAGLVDVVACIVHIERSRQTPDGRWNLACRGVAAARIEECWVEDGTGQLYMARLRLEQAEGGPRVGEAEAETAGNTDPAVADDGPASVVPPADSGQRVAAHEPPQPGSSRQDCLQFIQAQMYLLGLAHHFTDHEAALSETSGGESYREDPERFSWLASAALGGPPYGWATDEEQQALLDIRTVDERLVRLCALYHRAAEHRWSLNSCLTFGLRRWGPMLIAILIACFASAANSWMF